MAIQPFIRTAARGACRLIAIASLAAGVSACPASTTMPDVVGKPEAEARKTIEALGADVTVTKERGSGATGVVLRQTPAANAALPDTVQLVVSEGAPAGQREVPNVVGKTSVEAEALLVAAGLAAGRTTRQPGSGAAGTVLEQNPKAAAQVAPGTTVDLVVVDGAIVEVPNVVGSEEAAALTSLTQAGLRIGQVVRRLEGGGRAGTVVEQSPRAGLQVARDQPVDVTVKDDGVRVPSIVGRRIDAVAVSLLSSGLRYRMEPRRNSGRPAGTILEVIPAANTVVPRDSEVRVVLARDLLFPGHLDQVLRDFELRRKLPRQPRQP
jgi:eukaryotic-like serine/threonine-protein kinase